MKTEQQRIDGAIDTALLNADLLREQVAELEQALHVPGLALEWGPPCAEPQGQKPRGRAG